MSHEIDERSLAPGQATRTGTEAYARSFGQALASGHYRGFRKGHLQLSSLGLGTSPGEASDALDTAYADVIARAALSGINVFDTAAHYRHGRSARALGVGLRRAFDRGVRRSQVFVIAKAGFLTFEGGAPRDFAGWFDRTIAHRGLGTRADVSGMHVLTPAHVAYQLDRLRALSGLSAFDAFLIDQPEVHVAHMGRVEMHRRLEQCFAVCEQAAKTGTIGCYGIATLDALRAAPDALVFESLGTLMALAQRAATRVQRSPHARHHFRVVGLPFNQGMLEGLTRSNQATGEGKVAAAIEAADQLGLLVLGSRGMMNGELARSALPPVVHALAACRNDAQRSLQFNRSTPGLGVCLTGITRLDHLEDLLAVARSEPLDEAAYRALFAHAGH